MEKADILSMEKEELTEFMKGLGEAAYRGKQVFTRLHLKKAVSFGEMTELSLKLRELLKEKSRALRCKNRKKI